MKKKISVVASAVAAIAVCLVLIVGGTFALFTSRSEVNITVTTGKVKVDAAVQNVQTKSLNGEYAEGIDNAYGEIKLDGANVTLNNIVPGDGIKFDIVVTNSSNTGIKYRTLISVLEDTGLAEGLTITFGGEKFDGFTRVSAWQTLNAVVGEPEQLDKISVEIEFVDADDNNKYQDTSCTLSYSVEAVQSNAQTTNPVEGAVNLYSASDMAAFAKSVNAGNTFEGQTVVLNADLDLTGMQWNPIGSKEEKIYFKGTFDGQGHKVTGMSVSGDYVGFFGAIENATIKNLTVEGSASGTNVAGICARMESGLIENCTSNVAISSDNKAGGIVCLTNKNGCTIKNCSNYGVVTGKSAGVAGIVGYSNANTAIEGCSNYGAIGNADTQYSGGIVGYSTGADSTISGCVNEGTIIGNGQVGGILAIKASGDITISNCTNRGTIAGTDKAFAGGIVASVIGTVQNCSNTASVHGYTAGGVVGSAGGDTQITNCSGGQAAITSPSARLGFTGNAAVLDLSENTLAGRILGVNAGGGQNCYTTLIIDDTNGDDYSAVNTVGLCGIYTTWANLKVESGTLHGDPYAGNGTYIILQEGAVWGERAAGTYTCGSANDSTVTTHTVWKAV